MGRGRRQHQASGKQQRTHRLHDDLHGHVKPQDDQIPQHGASAFSGQRRKQNLNLDLDTAAVGFNCP
jgi:hypothetical protein